METIKHMFKVENILDAVSIMLCCHLWVSTAMQLGALAGIVGVCSWILGMSMARRRLLRNLEERDEDQEATKSESTNG